MDLRKKQFYGWGCDRVFQRDRGSGDWLFVKHNLITELNKTSISVANISSFMSEAGKIEQSFF